jgi:hypothetical protein
MSKNPDRKRSLNEQSVEVAKLRSRVRAELRASGFVTEDGRLRPRKEPTKQAIRDLHKRQRAAILKRSRPFIDRWEDKLINEFADGGEIEPRKIRPVVTRVDGAGFNAALFRFATLHWTVPVSVGYGRRTRFLVHDENTEKLIGVFALGDPVYNLRVRDEEIKWGVEQRSARLYNVLDAFVLGAVPPYRELLGGKLIAMAATSSDTNELIADKYRGTRTRISKKEKDPRPVLITTTSALGRSSLFNRLKYRGRLLYRPIGYTEGFGHFQFSDSLFADLCDLLRDDGGIPDYEYGGGPNWRIRTIRQALSKLDIEDDLLRHGVQRQVFLAPLAINWKQYLRGDADVPRWYRLHLNEQASFYRRRWAVPRSQRDDSYKGVFREGMRLSRRSTSR